MSEIADASTQVLTALAMRASWIAAPGATGPGSWLLRRDLILAPLLADPAGGEDAIIESAQLFMASTGDVTVMLDAREVLDVRALDPTVAAAACVDVTDLLVPGGQRVEHLSLAVRLVDDRPEGVPPAVLGGLVLRVRRASAPRGRRALDLVVVGTDDQWWTAPGPITFAPREDPGRRLLEVHDVPASGTGDAVTDELEWTRFGVMHTGDHGEWHSAVDRGRHPSLVHPPVVVVPPLVEEVLVPVAGHVLAPGGVQCLDLGQTVSARPVLALPDGARRPLTLWGGPAPGSPPRGGEVRIDTHGRVAVLEAHGTCTGRWLHVHGAPDLDTTDIAMPVRMGILPRPFGLDVSDELVSLLLSDALASLRARAQEQYRGESGAPLLAQIARTARAALVAGADTWRSARALESFLRTARPADPGLVVDAIAPGGPVVDLDEHTYALPAWVADQATVGTAPSGAGRVLAGIATRLLHRIEHGPSPAERMATAAAALDALGAFARLARRSGGDVTEFTDAAALLREQATGALRGARASGGRGTWLAATGDPESSAEATAMAVLSGLAQPEDAPFTLRALRPALADVSSADPDGLVRAALIRAGGGTEVVASHREGDDVPPIVLTEVLEALTGLTMDGDRVHVRPPSLPVEGIDLDLGHRRGDVQIRWVGTEGTVVLPENTHLLVHEDGAAQPVWYNSGTTSIRRPDPAA